MIWARSAWYFSNEVEQLEGPFVSEEDAKEAEKLYGKHLNNHASMTREEKNRLWGLYHRWEEDEWL